jgi:four helix bundle protein
MDLFPFQKLDVYRASRELAQLVQQAQLGDAELRDQATRAAKSVFLNIAEGLPERSAAIRRRHFGIARNSLGELAAALDLALVLGVLSAAHGARLETLLGRIWPMLHGLLRSGR